MKSCSAWIPSNWGDLSGKIKKYVILEKDELGKSDIIIL